MSSKAAVLAANAEVWAELREWKQGHNTMELNRIHLRDAKYRRGGVIIQNDVSDEQRKLEVETSGLTISAIQTDTALLQRQLSEWKAGVRTWARSRSPRRDEIKADSTSSRRAEALGYVAAHTFIRSEAETRMKAIITERDATIAKQAKLIADLQAGKGPIGPVLRETFFSDALIAGLWEERMDRPEMKVSVSQYIKKHQATAFELSTKMMFN